MELHAPTHRLLAGHIKIQWSQTEIWLQASTGFVRAYKCPTFVAFVSLANKSLLKSIVCGRPRSHDLSLNWLHVSFLAQAQDKNTLKTCSSFMGSLNFLRHANCHEKDRHHV